MSSFVANDIRLHRRQCREASGTRRLAMASHSVDRRDQPLFVNYLIGPTLVQKYVREVLCFGVARRSEARKPATQ